MKQNAPDAVFCQYCGQPFEASRVDKVGGSNMTGEEKTS